MQIEVPASEMREARARIALILGAAELEAFGIRLRSRKEAAALVDEAKNGILESNRLLLDSVREQQARYSKWSDTEGRRRALAIRERTNSRMSEIAGRLLSGFDNYISSLTGLSVRAMP